MRSVLWQSVELVRQGKALVSRSTGRTVAGNGSPCATGPLSCLSCMSVTLVYCGQTIGWITMPLGTEAGLGPGDIMLDGDPAPSTERGTAGPSLFGPCLLWPKRSLISATAELLFSVCLEFHSLAFSASTMLGRRQEEHPTCENLHQL